MKKTPQFVIAKELYLSNLKKEGYRVIDCPFKPDAIAIKGNKVLAVNLVGKHHVVGQGWRKAYTKTQLEKKFKEYDGLLTEYFLYAEKLRFLESIGTGRTKYLHLGDGGYEYK